MNMLYYFSEASALPVGAPIFGSALILLLSPAPPFLCYVTVAAAPLSSDGLSKATVYSDL